MAEKKHTPVTLVRGNRKITVSLPREVVQFKAAGWREETPAPAPAAPVDAPKPTGARAADGGSKK